jgi:hypothetical protein
MKNFKAISNIEKMKKKNNSEKNWNDEKNKCN